MMATPPLSAQAQSVYFTPIRGPLHNHSRALLRAALAQPPPNTLPADAGAAMGQERCCHLYFTSLCVVQGIAMYNARGQSGMVQHQWVQRPALL